MNNEYFFVLICSPVVMIHGMIHSADIVILSK